MTSTCTAGDDDARRFRSAFDHASIGMALVAPDGRWLDVNRSFCELVGYDAAQLLRLTEQQLTHPDDLASRRSRTPTRALAGEITSYQREKRYVHSLGHPVWVHMSASLVRSTTRATGRCTSSARCRTSPSASSRRRRWS